MVTLASSRLSRWHLPRRIRLEIKVHKQQNGWQDAIQTAAKMVALRFSTSFSKVHNQQNGWQDAIQTAAKMVALRFSTSFSKVHNQQNGWQRCHPDSRQDGGVTLFNFF